MSPSVCQEIGVCQKCQDFGNVRFWQHCNQQHFLFPIERKRITMSREEESEINREELQRNSTSAMSEARLAQMRPISVIGLCAYGDVRFCKCSVWIGDRINHV